jgi:Zn-dependent protease with chaperone function
MEASVQGPKVKLALLSAVVLLQAQASLAQVVPPSGGAPQATSPTYLQSRTVYRSMMNDPELNRLNQRTQDARLKTAVDFGMQQFFDTNPLLQHVLPDFLQQLDSNVVDTMMRNQLSMTEITMQSNPQLRRKVERALKSVGFSEQQSREAKIYRALGGVNAYTFAYSPDRVGLVYLTGLDALIPRAEMIGVILHELGHVRSGHVKYGMLDSVMQISLMQMLAKVKERGGNGTNSAQFTELIHQMITTRSAVLAQSSHEPGTAIASRASNFQNILGKAYTYINQQAQFQSIRMFQNYLDTIISHMKTMEIEPRYAAILLNARQRLEPGDIIGVDLAQVAEALTVWNLAYSRERETSADYYGTLGGRPSRMAMADARLAGGEVSRNPDKAEIKRVLKSAAQAVRGTMAMATRADYMDIIGGPGSSDHPNSNLRVVRSGMFDQHIDRIAMANPFLQIVSMLDQARAEIASLDHVLTVNQAEMTARGLDQDAESLSPAQKAMLEQFQALDKNLNDAKEEVNRQVAKIEPQITTLLMDPGFGKRHPRATGLLDFRLAQKQLLENQLADLRGLAEPKDPAVNDIIKMIQRAISRIIGDPIVKTAVQSIQTANSSPEELRALEVSLKALNEQASLTDTMRARQTLATLSKSESRIALDITYEPKSSGTHSSIQGVFKGEKATCEQYLSFE